ncbi:hypothetical protein MPSEU_000611600 [Mayamaea pseudoterrestris]|nr:hypothetical protein MPSEU_000611600 [Mayamaea pseudoterrestris]
MAPALYAGRDNRAATKQQMMDNIESEKFDPANVDPRSKEDTQMFIDHMQAKLDNQINLLKAEKENQLNKLKQVFGNGMLKMAKGTRKMTIAEFNAANSCDIVSIIRKTKELSSTSSNDASLTTPSMIRRKGAEPTPRTVRRGEQVVSCNGSPVDLYEEGTLVATVTKNSRREPSMEIHVGQGKFINIGDADELKEASTAEKAVAHDNLKALRAQIDNLMSKHW